MSDRCPSVRTQGHSQRSPGPFRSEGALAAPNDVFPGVSAFYSTLSGGIDFVTQPSPQFDPIVWLYANEGFMCMSAS